MLCDDKQAQKINTRKSRQDDCKLMEESEFHDETTSVKLDKKKVAEAREDK